MNRTKVLEEDLSTFLISTRAANLLLKVYFGDKYVQYDNGQFDRLYSHTPSHFKVKDFIKYKKSDYLKVSGCSVAVWAEIELLFLSHGVKIEDDMKLSKGVLCQHCKKIIRKLLEKKSIKSK